MSATISTLPVKTRPAPELEGLVLGGVLDLAVENPGLVEGLGLVVDDFLDPVLRSAWWCILGMAARRSTITASTVFAEGVSRKRFDDQAAAPLRSLAASSALARSDLAQVARDLRRVAHLRRVRAVLVQQVQVLDTAANPAQVAATLEALAARLSSDFEPDSDAEGDVYELHDRWNEHREKGTSPRLSSGLPLVDRAIGGGFPEQGLVLLAADSGVGKTSVLASMIRAMLEADPALKVGVFGLEDGVSWLPRRWAARDLGIPLSALGSRLSDELETQRAGMVETHAALARRIVAYRRDDLDGKQLVYRAIHWKEQLGVSAIFVDVLTDVRNDGWEAIAEDARKLRNFSFRFRCPVIAAVHVVADKNARSNAPPGPPSMSGIAGGRALDRRARLMLGLWNKGDALRMTVLKNTEGGPKGATIEFERHIEAGMVSTSGGDVVDIKAEAAQERKAKDDDLEAKTRAKSAKRAAERLEQKERLEIVKARAKEAAAAAKKAQAQPMLLDVPETTK